jgi:hypothetical protein
VDHVQLWVDIQIEYVGVSRALAPDVQRIDFVARFVEAAQLKWIDRIERYAQSEVALDQIQVYEVVSHPERQREKRAGMLD